MTNKDALNWLRHRFVKFADFAKETGGNFAIMAAILMVPMLVAAGMAIDYTTLVTDNSNLQEAVDVAVIAAVIPAKATDAEREAIAEKYIRSNYRGIFRNSNLSIIPNASGREVSVLAQASITTSIMNIAGVSSIDHNASATATISSDTGTCIFGLNKTLADTVTTWGSPQIETTCGVHSNSVSSQGLTSSGAAIAKAGSFCSSGGFSGSFSPTPEKNCAPIVDPYASLPVPSSTGCSVTGYRSSNGVNNISPGIYCGGMKITKGTVKLTPGLYVIKDGSLDINSNETVSGDGVTFYLIGSSDFSLTGQADLQLSAPKTGTYAGMLFVSHPDAGTGKDFKIAGGAETKLVGISYFPKQVLDIGGNGTFGANSKFMALVADVIQIRGNAHLKVNLDPAAEGYSNIVLPGKPTIPLLVR